MSEATSAEDRARHLLAVLRSERRLTVVIFVALALSLFLGELLASSVLAKGDPTIPPHETVSTEEAR